MALHVDDVSIFFERCVTNDECHYFLNTDGTIKYRVRAYTHACDCGPDCMRHRSGRSVEFDILKTTPVIKNILRLNSYYEKDTDDEDEDDFDEMEGVSCMRRSFFLRKDKKYAECVAKEFSEYYEKCLSRRICDCEDYFINDGYDLCLSCKMFSHLKKQCSICSKKVNKTEFIKMICCNQEIHKECYERMDRCPFCRETFNT